MVVKTEKGWVALKKDRFTYQVLGTYATRSEATAAVAAAGTTDNAEDRILRTFFWEE